MAHARQKRFVSLYNRGATAPGTDGLMVILATRPSFYYQVDGRSAAKRFAISLIVLQAVPCTGGL
jgi:hypothetical protein